MTLDRFCGSQRRIRSRAVRAIPAGPASRWTRRRREVFSTWVPDATPSARPRPRRLRLPTCDVIVGAANLAESIRRYGHLAAQLDPLGSPPLGDPSLSPQAHGITDDDLKRLPASLVGGPVAETSAQRLRGHREAAARLLLDHRLRLSRTCSSPRSASGCATPPNRAASCRRWIRASAEALLDRITQVDVFERFLQRTFPGKTRFSIEGLDMLVPMLDEIMGGAAGTGTRHMVIGMAHRGRLNVLAHVLHKPYAQILAEFKDPIAVQMLRLDLGWMGDVKYHAGAHHGSAGGPACS